MLVYANLKRCPRGDAVQLAAVSGARLEVLLPELVHEVVGELLVRHGGEKLMVLRHVKVCCTLAGDQIKERYTCLHQQSFLRESFP